MRRAVRRAADGKALDVDEAAALLAADGERLDELLAVAGGVRDAGLREAGRPGVVTYSRKVFIPLTRLCRDRCHYCTFATVPHRLPAAFLERDEVLAIAREGAAQGCKEALFTLGDRPEERWPAARQWLDERGYDSTLDYVRACAIAVLEETGLLPHLNPGVLSWAELQRLKPVAPSMGMMLETTATRLWSEPGGPHYGSPDKEPAVRLRVLDDAGRVGVPFTTGILIGIGETRAERADAIFAMRRTAREFGHIQEVIVQNFRAKPDTAMRGMPDAELRDLAATVAVARIILGPRARLQAPPNLIDAEFDLLLRAGIDDWGGVSPVTPDHVNPERPWPADRPSPGDVRQVRLRHCESASRSIRSTCSRRPRAGSTRDLPRTWPRLADARTGLADEDAMPVGRPVAGAGRGLRRRPGRPVRHHRHRWPDRLTAAVDFDSVYGDWAEVAAHVTAGPAVSRTPTDVLAGLKLAAENPARAARGEARGRRAGAVQRRRLGPRRAHPDRRRPAPRGQRRRRHVRGQPQHQLHQRLLRGLPVLRVRPARARR